ncbi:trans-sulfuration enzyme family protein [Parvularcula lutaonensis]|uniref:Trans-sulfuration enzyme family protein n=1 Tax=Parvularcula lutaonensis TaxID=491923 RepID=A0ABV7M6R5_9PROT|nr:PLP-dependent transferase [Parvularcula lutaonensis]GGY56414.1 O-succinylhomoserine (thiol)-lyase [Parvularcula lutaonensis]
MNDEKKLATILATTGVARDEAFGSVAPPIGLSTTFRWQDHRKPPRYDYARKETPNREELAACLAKLEGAERGVITASGMAAIDLCLNLVGPGDLVLAPHDCYGGTHRLLTHKARRGLFDILFADLSDPEARDAAFALKPKLAYLETPSNPLMRVTDLAACTQKARAAGCLTVADNTFLSPVLQNPIALGCDLVVHSTTKFISGHSDVVGGAVLAAKRDLGDELAWWANCTGVTGPAFDSWLTLRGVRTLKVRVEEQQRTAERLARFLEADERIARVHYPGLESHPQHALAKRQQKGFGSMLSAELRDGLSLPKFLEALTIPTLAESLGGFETLVCVPDTMTHAGMEEQARREAGITPGLLRFSIGLEDASDLQDDLAKALSAAQL